MAALSVQRLGSASRRVKPWRLQARSNSRRKLRLQVTPPDAVTQRTPFALGGADGFLDEHFHNGRLHAGAEVADFLRVLQPGRMVADEIAHGGFEAAEAEIVIGVAQQRAREIAGVRIALGGQPVNDGAGGIGQPHELAGLVETFAGGIVNRAAQDAMVQLGLDATRAACARR